MSYGLHDLFTLCSAGAIFEKNQTSRPKICNLLTVSFNEARLTSYAISILNGAILGDKLIIWLLAIAKIKPLAKY